MTTYTRYIPPYPMPCHICHMTGHGKRPLHMTGHGKRPVIYSVYELYIPSIEHPSLDCCHRRYRRFHRYRRQYFPISCYMSRYRGFHVTRYRVMSDETRYRVTLTQILTLISGTRRYRVILSPISYTAYPISVLISGPISGCPISATASTDIGVNIGYNIG